MGANHAPREGELYIQRAMIEAILWRRLSCKQTSAVGNSSRLVVSGTLRFKEVELTTLNKALLGRQPKHFEFFCSLMQF